MRSSTGLTGGGGSGAWGFSLGVGWGVWILGVLVGGLPTGRLTTGSVGGSFLGRPRFFGAGVSELGAGTALGASLGVSQGGSLGVSQGTLLGTSTGGSISI